MSDQGLMATQFYFPESRLAFIKKVQAQLMGSHIAVVQGATGTGKTTIIEECLTGVLDEANKAYIACHKNISDVQVRSQIIEQLFGHVLFDPEMPLLTSFIEFNQPNEMLVAIDNAHYLSGKLIGELLQLFSERVNLSIRLHIVLAFDANISSTLANLNSGLLSLSNIPKLSKGESYQLLKHYQPELPSANHSGVKRWLDNAKGVPIAVLAYDSAAIEDEKGSVLNLKLWVSVVITISLLLPILLFINNDKSLPPQQIEKTVVSPTVTATTAIKVPAAEVQEPQAFNLDEPEMAKIIARPSANSQEIYQALLNQTVEKEQPLPDQANSTESTTIEQMIVAKSQQVTNAPVSAPETQQQTTELEAKETQTRASDSQTIAVDEGKPDELNIQPDSVITSVADTAEPQQDLLSTQPQVDSSSADSIEPIGDKGENETPIDTLEQTDVEPQSTNEIRYRIDNQHFLSLPNDHFVLQLTAVSSQRILAQYLTSAPVDASELNIYKIRRSNSDWIVVTYGLFATIAEAREAATIIDPNAWAKSVAVIQQQINTFAQSQLQQ